MAEAKLAPNLPDWMVQHANRYIASGGTDGHLYKINVPGRGEITAPALLLTTTGRKSGEKFIFPQKQQAASGEFRMGARPPQVLQHRGQDRRKFRQSAGCDVPPLFMFGHQVRADAMNRVADREHEFEIGERGQRSRQGAAFAAQMILDALRILPEQGARTPLECPLAVVPVISIT